jgi:nucleotide-binding universal stress UspA family protein
MRVLVLLDLSEPTDELLRATTQIVAPAGGEITLLNVACPDADFEGDELRQDVSREGIAAELRRRHRRLQEVEASLRFAGLDARSLMVRCSSVRGNPVSKLLAEIDRLRPDLIVVGSRARGALYRLVMGSTTDSVVRHALCPVLLVPFARSGARAEAGRPDPPRNKAQMACGPAGAP